jgi:hypothetical protein
VFEGEAFDIFVLSMGVSFRVGAGSVWIIVLSGIVFETTGDLTSGKGCLDMFFSVGQGLVRSCLGVFCANGRD